MTGERSTGAMPSSNLTLVLYDGVCGLCNRLVAFLLRHDRNDQFRFAPLQSELAQKFLRRYGLDPKDFDSLRSERLPSLRQRYGLLADWEGSGERSRSQS